MIPIVTPQQMIEAERTAIDAGTPASQLMFIAASRISSWIDVNVPPLDIAMPLLSFGESEQVVVGLAGPGNNGGDTILALANLVEAGWRCIVIPVGRTGFDDVPIADELLKDLEISDDLSPLLDADVILDGIFGNGARPSLPDDVGDIVQAANDAGEYGAALRIAIDVPTGVDSLTGEIDIQPFTADITLSIGFPKVGLFLNGAADHIGQLVPLDIGLAEPPDFTGPRLIERAWAQRQLPVRTAFAHKRSVGSLLIVGGAPGYYGAPRLSAEAAYRVGAGLVGLSVPRRIVPTIAAQIPEAIYHPIHDADARRAADEIRELVNEFERPYSALVIGPGLGRDEPAEELLQELFLGQARHKTPAIGFGDPGRAADLGSGNYHFPGDTPAVIDADALNWLANQDDWPALLEGSRIILTPHPGEMSRLTGRKVADIVANPFETAAETASSWGQVVVLKCGFPCVGLLDGSVWVSPFAPSELATAGTGDVLSGIIGGFLAQGLEPADAARTGLVIGAVAGQHARLEHGPLSVIARDVIAHLSTAISELADGVSFR